jgi:hypothetical protein
MAAYAYLYDRRVAVRDPSQRFSYLFEPVGDETAGDVVDEDVVDADEVADDGVADDGVAGREVPVADSGTALSKSPRRWWPWFAAAAGAVAAAIALSVWPKPAVVEGPAIPPPQPVATTTSVPVVQSEPAPPPAPPPPVSTAVTTDVTTEPVTAPPSPSQAPSPAPHATSTTRPSRPAAPTTTSRPPVATSTQPHDGPGPHGGLLGGGGLL